MGLIDLNFIFKLYDGNSLNLSNNYYSKRDEVVSPPIRPRRINSLGYIRFAVEKEFLDISIGGRHQQSTRLP